MEYQGSVGQHLGGDSVCPILVEDRKAVVYRYNKDSVDESQTREEDQLVVREELDIMI